LEIFDLIFLDSIVEKLARKHSVQTQEVREVFMRFPLIRFIEKGNRQNENVYAAYGQTETGRDLIVFFIFDTPQPEGVGILGSTKPLN